MRLAALWFAAAGVLMIARAAVEVAGPAYWDPVTPLDYAAVWLATAMMLGLGVALLLWWRASPVRRGVFLVLVAGLGAFANGVGNALEDAFGNRDFGADLWVYGGGTLFIGLVAAGILALSVNSRYRLSGLFYIGFVAGFVLVEVPGLFLLSPASLFAFAYWINRTPEAQAA